MNYYDSSTQHGFLLSGGTYTTIDFPGAAAGTYANAINDSDQIVGAYGDAGGDEHGYLLSGGQFTTIDFPGAVGLTAAQGINDSGQIVGYYVDSGGSSHGFLLSDGTYTTIDFPAGTNTQADGINDSGQIVGTYDSPDGTYHGFLYSTEAVIKPTTPTFDATDGGVNYGYTISGADLPQATTVDLYWASSTTTASEIGDPIATTTSNTAQGTYNLHATPAQLGTPPPGAKDLLVVADPDNVISPADPSKVQALALAGIEATSLSFASDGSLDYGYQITGGDLPEATTVDLYWAGGTTPDTEIGDPIATTTTDTAQGTYPLQVSASDIGSAPSGAKYLIAVADPDHLVESGDHITTVTYDPFNMVSATSPDSEDITFSYDVNEAAPAPDQPLAFGIYRSSSYSFDPSTAIFVNQVTEDDYGNDFSEALGNHTAVVTDPDALLPDPLHEYVYVVADPDHTIGDPDGVYHEAHYRKFVLGVVSHGLLPSGQVTGIPAWESEMAQDLQSIDGFDQVIPFNWSLTSNVPLPNLATAAGNNLASQIISAADALVQNYGSQGDVVDLDLIGHSRGAVVISQALQDLDGTTDPVLAGGYVKMTVLDPHPANNQYGLASFSSTSPFASLVLMPALSAFQTAADDPQVVIPSNVDSWDDVYQQTPSTSAFGLVESYMNLWGDSPGQINNQSGVSPTLVQNLTGNATPALGLIGHSEVPDWYDTNIVQQRLIFEGYPLPNESLEVTHAVDASNQGQSEQPQAANLSVVVAGPSNSTPGQSGGPTVGDTVRVSALSPSLNSPVVTASVVSVTPLLITPASTQTTTQDDDVPGAFQNLTKPVPSPSVTSKSVPQTKSVTVKAVSKSFSNGIIVPVHAPLKVVASSLPKKPVKGNTLHE